MTGARGLTALGRLVAAAATDADGDAALLARYAATGDEAAFAALVRRHGPLVRAVCRRHLQQPADVDDAVQATFLVLARRAGSVHTAAGPFLYRVAERTAWRLRRAARQTDPLPELTPAREGLPPDVRLVVADELRRLPEPYRMAVELRYVAGYSTTETAARLGWPKGTVLTRLAWARKRLRVNLGRRGVALGGSLAAVLLDRATAREVRVTVGGESGRVISLCEGVVRAMALTKLGWAAGLTAVAVAGVAVGTRAVGQPPKAGTPVARTSVPPSSVPSLPPADSPGIALPVANPNSIVPPSPVSLPGLEVPQSIPPATVQAAPEKVGKTYTVTGPVGVYVREFADGERFAVRFEDDRLYAEANYGSKENPITVSLEADYALSKEGVVFGVITGLEGEALGDTSGLIGAPFAVRVRLDGTTLSVSNVRLALVADGRASSALTHALRGRYTGLGKDAVPPVAKRAPTKPKFPAGEVGLDSIPSRIPPSPTVPVNPSN